MSRSIFSVFRVVQISLQWILEPLNHPNKKSGTHYQSLKGQVGRHHRLKGHEFELALGDGDGQGSLACCNPRGHRVGHDWATYQQQQKGRVCFFFKVKSLSRVRLFGTPWTVRLLPGFSVHGSLQARALDWVILHLRVGDRAREALPIRWTSPLRPPLSLCCYARDCPHL